MTIDVRYPAEGKCRAAVWKRDTYRHTGRGKSGFSMHYNKCQCRRKPLPSGYCWQHEQASK